MWTAQPTSQRPSHAYDSAKMFVAGGTAGAIARTATAPLDRVKLLLQVQAWQTAGSSMQANASLVQTIKTIWREEGLLAFWKGNSALVIRIFPYSAAQLGSNDQYKRMLVDHEGNLSVLQRLAAGAAAGMTATTLTHPLDVVRLRLALPKHNYKGVLHTVVSIARAEGTLALYKGLGPTLLGIAPYAALNLASYDLLKKWVYGGTQPQHAVANLLLGAVAGTFAATVCYPLDTIRRRMQMRDCTYTSQRDAISTIFKSEGVSGFFRGWLPNVLKVVPQSSIRFVSYELLKSLLAINKAKTDT